MKISRIVLSLFVLILFLAACSQQDTPPPTPADVELSLRAEPDRLAVGETTLIVSLKKADGTPIDGAALRIHGDMDHEGMAPVIREVSESVGGEYHVPFEWTMGGGWIVTVTAQLPNNGGEISQTFDFFVEAISSESIINHGHEEAAPMGERPADSDIRIGYQVEPDPARLGDAVITLTVTDAAGAPVADASVEVTADMAHPGMAPVSGVGEHTSDGRYTVPLRWTMAGEWLVHVHVTLADGSQHEQGFPQHVETD